MKIFVTGTRGIPDIPGGVEKHCQELYPLIASKGHQVTLATRIRYVETKAAVWGYIKLIHIYSPNKKSLEAIVHTFLSIIIAKKENVDLIHIHGIGPSLLTPFARLLGLKVIVTNHGPDYEREKWGRFAKFMLRLGEYVGGRYANQVIVISSVIADIIERRCGRNSNLIYNGVTLPTLSNSNSFLITNGIKPKKYILAVARFVPEKGLHDLIEAFEKFEGDYQLVIAGDADYKTAYSNRLKRNAKQDKRIILTGYITGENLNQIYSNARLFCLPSYFEGLPIALLEAMSYGLPVLVSDIPANLEVDLPKERFFKCGDVNDLRKKLRRFIDIELSEKERREIRINILRKYNWLKIAEQTIEVYERVVKVGKD